MSPHYTYSPASRLLAVAESFITLYDTPFLPMLLISTVLIPFIGAIVCTLGNNHSNRRQWVLSLSFSTLTFLLSMVIWLHFDPNAVLNTYQFTTDTSYSDVNFGTLHLGLDGLSLYFFMLTTFITPICLLSGRYSIRDNVNTYVNMFLILEGLLCLVFTVQDLLLFYVFFESVLIPLFLMIGLYGSGEMKIRASYLRFLYTLFGSRFMLRSFMMINFYTGTTNIQALTFYNIGLDAQRTVFMGIMLSMAIKTPMIPFNTWLTYAHSEAPVGGSIVLAGVILKLATYGYMRIMLQLLPDASNYFAPLIMRFASISVIYGSLTTIRQIDFKKRVAYSSVAHMGVVVIGVFSNTIEGIEGSIILSIAHGLVSPALFFLVGGVVYDRFHSRNIKYYRGLALYMPVFSAIRFIFSISNAAVPLTANWMGEFMVLAGVMQRNVVGAVLASTGIVLSVIYSVWLFARMSFGTYSPYLRATVDLTRREYIILLPLLVLTILFGVVPDIIRSDLHVSVSSILYDNSLG